MSYNIFIAEVYCKKCKRYILAEVPKVDMLTWKPNKHNDELVGEVLILHNKFKSGGGRFEQISKVNIKCPYCKNDVKSIVKYSFGD